MSGSQGHGNREKNRQRCPEDHKEPRHANEGADVGHRTRWHKGGISPRSRGSGRSFGAAWRSPEQRSARRTGSTSQWGGGSGPQGRPHAGRRETSAGSAGRLRRSGKGSSRRAKSCHEPQPFMCSRTNQPARPSIHLIRQPQRARRPANARAMVSSSAYSRSDPAGSPCAGRDTVTPDFASRSAT
jgi:hypothetical protein